MLLLFEDDNAIQYLLRDEFLAAQSAPLTSPRTAEPGPGQLTVVDSSGNKLSISGGKLQSAGMTIANADPLIRSISAFAVVAGRAVFANFNYGALGALRLGWGTTAGAIDTYALVPFQTSLYVYDPSALLSVPVSVPASTEIDGCVVLRASGAYYFIKLSGTWRLVWVSTTGAASVYAGISVHNTNVAWSNDYLRVRDLPAPFTTDYGLCTFNITANGQGALGSELISNGTFETDVSGWTNYNSLDTFERNTVSPIAGTGDLHIGDNENLNTEAYLTAGVAVTSGTFYEVGVKARKVDSRLQVIVVGDAAGTGLAASTVLPFYTGDLSTSNRTYSKITRATATATVYPKALINDAATQRDIYLDDFTIKAFALAPAQVSSADAIHHRSFTLPASPAAGQTVNMFYRGTAGEELNNCWRAYLQRNDANTAWDFRLDSISGGTATNRINVTGVTDATDTICVIVSGNTHDCYTKNGTSWSKRGGTVTNSQGAALTSCNYADSSGVTFGAFRSWARTSAVYSAELDKA